MIFIIVFMFLIVSFLYTFFTFCDTEKFNSNRECIVYILVSFYYYNAFIMFSMVCYKIIIECMISVHTLFFYLQNFTVCGII